jgi:acyl-CoA thioesterase-1
MVRARPVRTAKMEALIASVAREEETGLFPRFLLMQRAKKNEVGGLVAFDGLHNSGDGYRCIGQALARMINDE